GLQQALLPDAARQRAQVPQVFAVTGADFDGGDANFLHDGVQPGRSGIRPNEYLSAAGARGYACTRYPGDSPDAKGLPGPGLLAQLIVSRFTDHLPLHRLERVYQRQGLFLRRSTVCDWLAASADRRALIHLSPGALRPSHQSRLRAQEAVRPAVDPGQ